MLYGDDESRVLKTGNEELDRRIGGIPIPTLGLIEGANDTGKSVIAQQLTYGGLKQGLTISYITTENTAKSLLSQMSSLSLNVLPYYIKWQLYITSINVEGINWSRKVSALFLENMLKFISDRAGNRDVFIVDSMTHILTHTSEKDLLEFLSAVRRIVDERKVTIFMTLHPFALPKDLLGRMRSVCDAHLITDIKEMGDKVVRVLKISKLRGARKEVSDAIGFTIDPAFGIKVIPISLAKA